MKAVITMKLGFLVVGAALFIVLAGLSTAQAQTIELVSVDSFGTKGNNGSESRRFAMSADGRFVAFQSRASNLVIGDTNGAHDIFVHDRQTGVTERVSVDSAGNQSNSLSFSPSISADGRFVAFFSWASNLVAGDSNGRTDIFVHDRQTGATERANVDSAGNQANHDAFLPAISADGRYVTFYSSATNLVAGGTNGQYHVFLRDRQSGVTELISVDSAGNQGNNRSLNPALSADGRYVTFQSRASNLVTGDSNGVEDIFVHDRQTGLTELVSVDSAGNQANGNSDSGSISSDGRYVAFHSLANNLVTGDSNGFTDVFVHDRQTGVTELVSVDSAGNQANDTSAAPVLSVESRYVAFFSFASNLVIGDSNGRWDVFVHDRQTGATERVSVDSAGNEANHNSFLPAISADGRYVSFFSVAYNLSPDDPDTHFDVYVYDRGPLGNQPPIADAGPGQTVEATSPAGAWVTLDASASSDPDTGDTLSYEWIGPFGTATGASPNVTLPLGAHIIGLTVTDLAGATDNASVTIVVQDTTAPTIAAPADVTATAMGTLTAVALGDPIVSDAVDPAPIVGSDAPAGGFPPGSTTVTWTATDASGNSAAATQVVTVSFGFLGFQQPIEDLPVINSARAGQTIPVKWQISDGNSGYISDLSVVTSLQMAPTTCAPDGAYTNEVATDDAGSSGLRYDFQDDQFVYSWKTNKGLKNSCYYFVLGLADDTKHLALFKFR